MATDVKTVLDIFTQINAVPRCSKNEEAIGKWLEGFARDHGFETERDEAQNLLVRVPAKGMSSNRPPVVIQGHMDMVCEKTPDSSHDFTKDPIAVIRDGDWIHADNTTLGADNGIAVAMALAVATGDEPHPELEILVTVDEETGLTGAQNLRAGWLRGTELINIDSEDEGVFTIGCAGGRDTVITLPVASSGTDDRAFLEIRVGGLLGGHSGVDIHLQRANANRLLARVLHSVGSHGICIATLQGGSAHNAIPRDASSVIAVDAAELDAVRSAVAGMNKTLRAEFGESEPDLNVTVSPGDRTDSILDRASTDRLVDLLLAIPHGVMRMSADVQGLVETSTNLATVHLKDEELEVHTSQRSSFMTRLAEVGARIESVARLAGAEATNKSSYPPWEPATENPLLTRATAAFLSLTGKEPVIEIIHAGLECGVIGSKYPGMAMLSLGPTIERAHSPEERLHVPSLERTCGFLDALLASYA